MYRKCPTSTLRVARCFRMKVATKLAILAFRNQIVDAEDTNSGKGKLKDLPTVTFSFFPGHRRGRQFWLKCSPEMRSEIHIRN